MWSTRATTDRLIQRNVNLHRRKSISMVKVELDNERRISWHVNTIHMKLDDLLVRSSLCEQDQSKEMA